MTKTEEALCNGITFSVTRLVPTAIQEGELENASYYVIVYLSAKLDKVLMKFYNAPSYEPLKWNGEEVEGVEYNLVQLSESETDNTHIGYNYGHASDGDGKVYPNGGWIRTNPDKVYNGLMLYPGLKCLMVTTLKKIISHE